MRRLFGTLLAIAAWSGPALAQRAGARPASATPCCGIYSIDRATGVVTARETATGHVFRFTVKDRTLLSQLRTGQQVWADYASGMVSVEPGEPCCSITPAAAAGAQPDPAEPCCGLTAVDRATGVVTARVTASGRLFRFQVTDPALLRSIAPGARVWIITSGGTRRVGLRPGEPCCNVVGTLPPGLP